MTGQCTWCGRTDTERIPASPASGPDREECKDLEDCVKACRANMARRDAEKGDRP